MTDVTGFSGDGAKFLDASFGDTWCEFGSMPFLIVSTKWFERNCVFASIRSGCDDSTMGICGRLFTRSSCGEFATGDFCP